MGTSKRDRQRANRQARLEELARQARKTKTKRRGIRIGIIVVGALVLLFALTRLVGGDDDDTAAPTDTIAPVTTLDPTATTIDLSSTTVDPASATTGGPTTTVAPTTTMPQPFVYGAGECPKEDGSSEKTQTFTEAPKQCIDDSATYTAEVVTNRGDFTITLDPAQAPGNVNNFVVLARYHYYDGTTCHRVIKDFALQCGRPGEDESAPGYTVADELPTQSGYQEGMVVMANTGSPNSGGGQWFVVIGPDGESLPPQYSIIGKVTEGYDSTVRKLENLADPLANNGVPPLLPIDIESVTVAQS